jgi:hypothetical protein
LRATAPTTSFASHRTGLEELGHWVNGADRGHLTWGIFHFQKSG